MDAIVLKALTKDPNYRYQSADEMRADIEACLDGQPVAATAAMGSVGYGGYPDDQPTTALRSADGGATTMLPPMNPDDGGYGYDDRPDRRRQQKKSNTSTILLVVAAVLVLVGAVLIGRWVFSGDGVGNNTVAVPNLVGQSQKDAESLLTNSDLKVGEVTKKACEAQPQGKICEQNPEPKTTVDKDSSVDLVVSTGAPKVTVPSVIGLKLNEAKEQLEDDDYQFVVKTETRETSSDDPNTILDQDPRRGEEVEKGSTITLTVAKEEEKSTVPDVLGKTCDEAKAQMTANNLVGTCTEVETQDPNQVGKVIATSPEANSSADKNSTVTIQIGKAAEQEQVAVPTVTQLSLKDAKKALQDAGLAVGNIQGSQDDNAIVFTQDPQPNTPVAKGTAVNLVAVPGQGGNNGGGDNGGIFGGVTGTSARTED